MYGQNNAKYNGSYGYQQRNIQQPQYNNKPYYNYGVSSDQRPPVVSSSGGCCCSIMWFCIIIICYLFLLNITSLFIILYCIYILYIASSNLNYLVNNILI